ncbi:hypothetical protein [Actinomadura rudentiformis]|uniref:Uncharacterized protein n=1 Tax=Actinomadura rudentiformis TaxID=359158 RepID=A0A6H9YFR1_9ACTN|nr:hypothetical protein [Actinomadura rudentiformis]KAB2344880.1 hypothetical protein F8566_30285 [Actinomadura rudentiformis]
MPRQKIAVIRVTKTGITPTAEIDGDPANGHVLANTGRTVLLVRNADTADPHTLTLVTPGTVDGQPIGDRAIAIPAGATRWIGGIDPAIYSSALQVDVDSAQLKILALEP